MTEEINKKDIIICRCQDISLKEIEDAIDSGITDPEHLKRFLHIGMGPCQGRTCNELVSKILAQKIKKSIVEIKNTTRRPPLVSVSIKELLGVDNG